MKNYKIKIWIGAVDSHVRFWLHDLSFSSISNINDALNTFFSSDNMDFFMLLYPSQVENYNFQVVIKTIPQTSLETIKQGFINATVTIKIVNNKKVKYEIIENEIIYMGYFYLTGKINGVVEDDVQSISKIENIVFDSFNFYYSRNKQISILLPVIPF